MRRQSALASTCSFCGKREHWTEEDILGQPDFVQQYPPKGWHSAGAAPGFCSQACADHFAAMNPLWIRLTPPSPWVAAGACELPTYVPGPESEIWQTPAFDQDLLQFRLPDERVTLDVGWYPRFEGERYDDAAGSFRCVRVLDRDWDDPAAVLETRDPAEVFRWLCEQLRVTDG